MMQSKDMHDSELVRSGRNFLGILNDLKRRPEDAAKELGISIEEINSIINGEIPISSEIVNLAVKTWPINTRDFFIISDDCPLGVKIMSAEDSKKSKRVMDRKGAPYYEYRDTAMSTVGPFRPEWIMELCYVEDNEPNNPKVQWNNGHFMHQFTYFIGEVNFYYRTIDGQKKVAIMNTGDSMYVTPFVPHTFTTRKGAKENGVILALTYGNKLTGDVKHELSALSAQLATEFVHDFSTKQSASSSILSFHTKINSFTTEELSKRTEINKEQIKEFENGTKIPSKDELSKLARAFNVNKRDLMPPDKIEEKVIIKYHNNDYWYFPESTKSYKFVELAITSALPFSKAFEVIVKQNKNENDMDLELGLHQYVYNVGDTSLNLNWISNNKNHRQTINPGDSAYIKPFVKHNFRGDGKVVVLRIGGKIAGDSQTELSYVGKGNAKRAISESRQWFNTK